ncbi:anhydro-N-acetylmuramic acid kinase [Caulobacter segnis]|uniref:anhydro-N-acetylmuramic acid kinase n=1 Tax=Caulobacter segnis TaxID=88688 RepID=UPI0024105301|nr:anhydro-N-acetylmuramic acid kinase [Caulobacter segnis]MDG2522310.1 anhydro-N-acetylmuramic acid kinase [Caulobacter segnis]
MKVLGFMTGTSLDAVDMAVLETDGEAISAFGPAGERKLSDATRDLVLAATHDALKWERGTPKPESFAPAAQAVADEHFAAASSFLEEHGLTWADFDLVGMHGQTVLHERPTAERIGRTIQLGDAQALADRAGVPVAFDFRTADVAAGGEGAPLAPIYHLARARAGGLEPPVAILNIGGVANVTLIDADGTMLGFDTGPGNGMIDLLMQERGAGRFDAGGKYASVGAVDEAALNAMLAHPYFEAAPPKSLDRYDFSLEPVAALRLEDAAATLVAFTAAGAAKGVAYAAVQPKALIVCGGGRHNPELMKALEKVMPMPVRTAEDLGWRGDSIEAEAFAYLAARTAKGLPISFPGTTGVKAAMTGGRIVTPRA